MSCDTGCTVPDAWSGPMHLQCLSGVEYASQLTSIYDYKGSSGIFTKAVVTSCYQSSNQARS